LLIKYIKSVLWRAAKCLSYIEEARCLKVNTCWIKVWLPSYKNSRQFTWTPTYIYDVSLHSSWKKKLFK